MFRKIGILFLALAASTVLWAADGMQSILIDDFNDGDDQGWSHADFTPEQSAVYDASTGVYVLESSELIPADDPNAGTIVATWEGSRGRPQFANGVARIRMRANSPDTTCGVLLRANDQTHVDYGFFGSASFGTFYIERFDGSQASPQTIIAMADPDKAPFADDEDWNLEAGVVGHQIWLKVWKVGDPEPAQPLLALQDKEVGPQDGSLICVIAFFDPAAITVPLVDVSATFDDVTFTHGSADQK